MSKNACPGDVLVLEVMRQIRKELGNGGKEESLRSQKPKKTYEKSRGYTHKDTLRSQI